MKKFIALVALAAALLYAPSIRAGEVNCTVAGTPCFTAGSITGQVAVANGGTGISSYAKGDILVATGSTALAKRAVGTNGQVLAANSAQADGVNWVSPLPDINYISGSYYPSAFIASTTTVTAGTTLTLYFHNFFVPKAVTIDQLGAAVVAAGTSSNAKFALYNGPCAAGNALLSTANPTATATTTPNTGVAVSITPLALQRGTYCFATVQDGTPATFISAQLITQNGALQAGYSALASLGTTHRVGWSGGTITFASGFPATIPALTPVGTTIIPFGFFRAQ